MQARRWWCAALALTLVPVLAGEDASGLRPECSPATHCSYTNEGEIGEFFYNVSGVNVIVNYRDGALFCLRCNDMALDNPDLPRFPTTVRVREVTFKRCTPPKHGSFADAAAALNVTDFSSLTLDTLPMESVITHEHFAGLQRLTKLALFGKSNASIAPGALAALSVAPALHTLELNLVHTPAADLTLLPTSLQKLKVWDVHAVSAYFKWLPKLTLLDLCEKYPIAINASNATALKTLSVTTPNTVIPEDALPLTLTKLILFGWNDTRPMPKTRCAQLEHLKLTGTNNGNYPLLLPDEWLSSCSRLGELEMYKVPIRGVLPARLLANATSLESITIKHCSLTALPEGFLNDTLNLDKLDLSYNRLRSLPSGLFLHTKSIKKIKLSHNLLTSAVAESLSAVVSLQYLRLNNNNIGDLCHKGSNSTVRADTSTLSNLTALRHLYLSHTNVSHVCRDWREKLLNLNWLDLEDTAITIITYDDLKFQRVADDTRVVMGGGGAYELRYQREDYDKAITEKATKVSVTLYGSLVCNCKTYWAALTFRDKPSHAGYRPRCDGKLLARVDLDRLTCDVTSEDCATLPANCTCRKRDDYEHGSVVIVRCVALTELPRLPRAQHKWRLHLANNNISHIHADNVSENIVELDLRNNFIKRVDGETAAKLASLPQLRLAGNPLECSCESYEMLRALLDTKSQLNDTKEVICNGTGKPLTTVTPTPCTVPGPIPVHQSVLPLVLPLVMLMAVVILAYGFIARPATRLWIKLLLMRLGWMPRRFEPAEDDRPYDAFVSFAHEDEELVVEQLAARLESGSEPYRLCLHYRDWAPGEWIPAQIAASVRASRRTVAVVSAHYLQSGWARAEFREATAASLRDGTPRLIVVLLDDPDRLTLDADSELSTYVRHNVYVRWGDPWFWEKMKEALPLPRLHHLKKAPSSPAPATDIALVHRLEGRKTALAPAPPSHDSDEPPPRATPCSA